MDIVYSTIDIYNSLKAKYREYLKPEIISVAIVQTEEEVLLETTEVEVLEGNLEKQTTRRIDLEFIADGEGPGSDTPYFNPNDPIEKNARKFIDEFSPFSIINTTGLFHDEACEKISKKYNTFGRDG